MIFIVTFWTFVPARQSCKFVILHQCQEMEKQLHLEKQICSLHGNWKCIYSTCICHNCSLSSTLNHTVVAISRCVTKICQHAHRDNDNFQNFSRHIFLLCQFSMLTFSKQPTFTLKLQCLEPHCRVAIECRLTFGKISQYSYSCLAIRLVSQYNVLINEYNFIPICFLLKLSRACQVI